jgi:hypothetical protein
MLKRTDTMNTAEDQKRKEIADHRRFLNQVGPAETFASRLMDGQLEARIATLEAELEEPTP